MKEVVNVLASEGMETGVREEGGATPPVPSVEEGEGSVRALRNEAATVVGVAGAPRLDEGG